MWAKIDDRFMRHPKIIAAGRDARDLYLAALLYCSENLTDGHVPAARLRLLAAEADIDSPLEAAERLVEVGLWERRGNDGWQVHDYLEYQPSRNKALAIKEVRAEAGSIGGYKSADKKMQAKQEANAKANAKASSEAKQEANAKASSEAKQQANVNPVPVPVPVPSQAQEKDAPNGAAAEPPAENAVKLFVERFTEKIGERPDLPPKFTKALKDTLVRVGLERYQSALCGFFADDWASERGYSVETFVGRPIDRWVRAGPKPLSRALPKADLSPEDRRARNLAAVTGAHCDP